MFLSFEDKINSRTYAKRVLEELKQYERTHDLYEMQIGKCTVKCKNVERLEEYKKAISNPKVW